MTDIPKARALIKGVLERAGYLHIADWTDLEWALSLMTRKVRERRVNPDRQTMTPSIGEMARRLHKTTRLTNAEIGARLGVDGGRVSEALNGMWH